MIMTPAEIAREYRSAKRPQNQIQILADENCCTRNEIKKILIEQGCELPKNMMPKPKGGVTLTHEEAVALCQHIERSDSLPYLVNLVHVYEKCKKEAEG